MKRQPRHALRRQAVLAGALSVTLLLSSGGPTLAAAASASATGTAPTAGAQRTPKLPAPPFAQYSRAHKGLERALAPFTLPVSGFGTTALGSQSKIDSAAAAVSVLQQRTYYSALQQWQAQGAKPVSPSTTITINAVKDYTHVTTTSPGAAGIKVYAPGGLAANTQPALGLPSTVQTVDFPFTVRKTGLYALAVNYYLYPDCLQRGSTSTAAFTTSVSTVSNSPFCGRGTAAERGFLIDPPGTVPTVAASSLRPPAVNPAVAAATKQSGISAATLPAWINPVNSFVPTPPVPAWTISPTALDRIAATAKATATATTTTAKVTTPKATPTTGGAPAATAKGPAATTAAGAKPAPTASATATPTVPAPACAMNLTSPSGQPTGYNGYEYQELHQAAFPGMWTDASGKVNPKTGYVSFPKDNQGDNLYPLPTEKEQWQSRNVYDAQGIYGSPLLFCLSTGHHVLRMQMVREPMAITSLVFHGPAAVPTYQQALARWKGRGMQPVTCGMCVQVQADNINRMSDPTIQPGSDSYPSVVPHTHGYFILNDLNGTTFDQPNQWVQWKVTVPQTGLYKVGFMELQAQMQGLPATRRLTIDGKLPFQGAQWISIPFKNSWNMATLSQPNGQPALIGLTKGSHIMRLSTTLGLVGQAMAVIQQTTQRLGELQREIVMITGPTPNPQVDYNLPTNVPALIPQMKNIAAVLREQSALLTYDNGGHEPAAANSIDITANNIAQMAQHPRQIQLDMSEWTQDEQALGTWITQLQNQPVNLNWIGFAAPSYRFPSPNAGFFTQLKVTWQNFLLSFYRNYTGVGSVYTNAISVWVGFGQTWAAIMSQMANSEFTPATGIHVNFNVVPGGAGIVLLAQVSGHGPDVATGMPPTSPVDFALRGGAYAVSSFPNWSVVKKRFVPGATVPYQFTNAKGQTGTYAVPETQGMTLMFYRKDILSSLAPGGIKPPKTWQELYQIIPTLTSHGMEFYYGGGPQGYLPFLFQYGGTYYHKTSNGLQAALGTSAAYHAFKAWTGLYTQWNVPVAANLFTRFQTGEMPLGIGAYTDYVTFNAAAPQLAGLWSIAPIPATPYLCSKTDPTNCQLDTATDQCTMPGYPHEPAIPNGEVCKYNDTSGGASTAVMIPKSAKHPNEAWKFVEWWTSASVQLEFASDIEAIGGVQLAWNTANVQALSGLPWPQHDLNVFKQAWKAYQPEPIVPGGYIADRYINNIWTNVVINHENARAQLQWAEQNINDELYRQEINFGLAKVQKGRLATGS